MPQPCRLSLHRLFTHNNLPGLIHPDRILERQKLVYGPRVSRFYTIRLSRYDLQVISRRRSTAMEDSLGMSPVSPHSQRSDFQDAKECMLISVHSSSEERTKGQGVPVAAAKLTPTMVSLGHIREATATTEHRARRHQNSESSEADNNPSAKARRPEKSKRSEAKRSREDVRKGSNSADSSGSHRSRTKAYYSTRVGREYQVRPGRDPRSLSLIHI